MRCWQYEVNARVNRWSEYRIMILANGNNKTKHLKWHRFYLCFSHSNASQVYCIGLGFNPAKSKKIGLLLLTTYYWTMTTQNKNTHSPIIFNNTLFCFNVLFKMFKFSRSKFAAFNNVNTMKKRTFCKNN